MFNSHTLEDDIRILHYYANKDVESVIIKELILYFYIIIITGSRFGVRYEFINDPKQGLVNISIDDFVLNEQLKKIELTFKSKSITSTISVKTSETLFKLFIQKKNDNIINNRTSMFHYLGNLSIFLLNEYKMAFMQTILEYNVLFTPMAYRKARACAELSNSLKQFDSYLEKNEDLKGT